MAEDTAYYYLHPRYYRRSHRFWLIGHLIRYRISILSITILSIIAIGLQTYIPILFGRAIDDAIPEGNIDQLVGFATLIIGLGLARGVISYVAGIQNEYISQRVEMSVRVEFFENIGRKNMDFFNKSRVGDLMSQATQDTLNLTFAISPGIRSVIQAIFGVAAAAIAMVTLSPVLSSLFVIILPFYLYFLYRYAIRLQPVSMERQQRLAEINAVLQENLTGIRVVRTFSAQDREKVAFNKDIRDYEDILIKRASISAFFLPTLILGIMTAFIFLAGVYIIELTQTGPSEITLLGLTIPIAVLTIGDLIAFITLMGLLVFPTTILRFLLDITMLGFAGSERIFNTLTTTATLEKGDQINIDNIEGKVVFENVDFSYEEGGKQTISDFNLTIEPGQNIAIIGPTGSGKSTVGRLLIRLFDINSGTIKIDDVDIKDISLNNLRELVGVIEQDVFLFSTSIASNIAYGIQNVDQEQIEEAAKIAQAHEFISEFPEGYETVIGEKGVTLSGGQRQRVAMARTFITNPKILIMDDATSAVDAETESKIQKAMGELLKNRTTIIITHRLSTLKNADKIVFMRGGKIERQGTHDELLESFEPYRQIFAAYVDLPPIKARS